MQKLGAMSSDELYTLEELILYQLHLHFFTPFSMHKEKDHTNAECALDSTQTNTDRTINKHCVLEDLISQKRH